MELEVKQRQVALLAWGTSGSMWVPEACNAILNVVCVCVQPHRPRTTLKEAQCFGWTCATLEGPGRAEYATLVDARFACLDDPHPEGNALQTNAHMTHTHTHHTHNTHTHAHCVLFVRRFSRTLKCTCNISAKQPTISWAHGSTQGRTLFYACPVRAVGFAVQPHQFYWLQFSGHTIQI